MHHTFLEKHKMENDLNFVASLISISNMYIHTHINKYFSLILESYNILHF